MAVLEIRIGRQVSTATCLAGRSDNWLRTWPLLAYPMSDSNRVRHYSQNIPAGPGEVKIVHNLGTKQVQVQVWNHAGAMIYANVRVLGPNMIAVDTGGYGPLKVQVYA